jgi:hypothetical protein
MVFWVVTLCGDAVGYQHARGSQIKQTFDAYSNVEKIQLEGKNIKLSFYSH